MVVLAIDSEDRTSWLNPLAFLNLQSKDVCQLAFPQLQGGIVCVCVCVSVCSSSDSSLNSWRRVGINVTFFH
jgi:hypothetical protein